MFFVARSCGSITQYLNTRALIVVADRSLDSYHLAYLEKIEEYTSPADLHYTRLQYWLACEVDYYARKMREYFFRQTVGLAALDMLLGYFLFLHFGQEDAD